MQRTRPLEGTAELTAGDSVCAAVIGGDNARLGFGGRRSVLPGRARHTP